MSKPFETPMIGWSHATKAEANPEPVPPQARPAALGYLLKDPAEWVMPADAKTVEPVSIMPTVAHVPALRISGAHLPESVAELIAWFEKAFTCFQGPERAYFEIPAPEGATNRYVFTTYAYATRNTDFGPNDAKTAERALAQMIHADFFPLTLESDFEGTALFWRMPEKIAFTHERAPVLGGLIATHIEVEDGLKPKPSGNAVLKDESGNWMHLLGWQDKWTVRTRLCTPMLDIVGKTLGCAKPEGVPAIEV